MNIVMLIWSYWPGHEGGAERQCRKIVENSPRGLISYTILTSRYSFSSRRIEKGSDFTIVRLGIVAPLENIFKNIVGKILRNSLTGRWQNAVKFWVLLPIVWLSRLVFICELNRWIARNGSEVDIIHVHDSEWLAGVGQLLGQRNNIPVLSKTATSQALPIIGYDVPFRHLLDKLRRRCWFVAQHQKLKDELILQGVARDHVFLIPNGVEIPRDTALPDKGKIALYVGNFSQGTHWKAFDVLIGAWAIAHQQVPDATLFLLGDGDTSPWSALAKKLGCLESVNFCGRTTDPSFWYKKASLFILPSRVEGLSNALLEAQSYGLPCVVSDIPGNRAVVEDHVNGIIFPKDDIPACAKKIALLLKNPDLRLKLGWAARTKMIEKFNIESTVDKLLSVYKIMNKVTV